MINAVVEGSADEQTAIAVIRAAGRQVAKVVVRGGKTNLDRLIPRYNRAAAHGTWVIFRDSDGECPRELVGRLTAGIQDLSPSFLIRLAHPMAEAWLMADRAGFANCFRIREARIPLELDQVPHPKRLLLDLCATSSSRRVREDMVVATRRTGPLYVARINEFARTNWSVQEACDHSESLRRAVNRIRQLPPASSTQD